MKRSQHELPRMEMRLEILLVSLFLAASCVVFALMHAMPSLVFGASDALQYSDKTDTSLVAENVQALESRDIYDFMESFGLSQDDRVRYTRAFSLQEDGWWVQADSYIERIQNPILLPYILKQRLLSAKFHSTEQALSEWLRNNPRHEAYMDVDLRMRKLYPHSKLRPKNDLAQRQALQTEHASVEASSPYARGSSYPYNPQVRSVDAGAWRQAMMALGNGRYTQAREIAMKIIDRSGARSPSGWWIAGLASWQLNDVVSAAKYFSLMSECNCGLPAEERSAAAFWAYRAELSLGNRRDAARFLSVAAHYPNSFYGQIAESVMTTSPVLQASAVQPIPAEQWRKAAADKDLHLVMALSAVNKSDEAKKIFYRLSAQRLEVKHVVQQLGQALEFSLLPTDLAQKSSDKSYAARRFSNYPVPAWHRSLQSKSDKALVLAIVRQESGFNPRAGSPVGAKGLMQLMPATAASLLGSREMEVRVATSDDYDAYSYMPDYSSNLYDVGLNLRLGQNYVKRLAGMSFIKGNIVLLAASYNAGPKPVEEWLASDTLKDPLLFIESIPYGETRGYVKNVLRNYWVYQHLLNQPVTSAGKIAEGVWPTLSL